MLHIYTIIINFQFGATPNDEWEEDKEDPGGKTPAQKAKGFFFKSSKIAAKVTKLVADTGVVPGPIGEALGAAAEIVEEVVEDQNEEEEK